MEFLLGGMSACCAGVLTNPLEVIKTRVQLQGELARKGNYKVHYKNVFHAFYVVARNEGILSLQKGLTPAILYQFFMNSVRLGVYQVIDNLGVTRNANGDIIFARSVAAGAFAGCAGSVVGSPFYMIKTQLQARSGAEIAVGHQHVHTNFNEAVKHIYRRHGLQGLWRGATGSMCRVTAGSAIQLPVFSKLRNVIDEQKIFPPDSMITNVLSAVIGGAAVVAVMTPFDVMSTRLYNQPVDPVTGKGLKYNGIFDTMLKTYRTESVLGLYKGWSASLLRLGPHTVLNLVFWQEFRKLYFRIRPTEMSQVS
ncbi:Solute carrier family 25 member 35 [Halotydeus destructor]|nr:Solute carrier family 25 member 35 [Halotydeus destructor]